MVKQATFDLRSSLMTAWHGLDDLDLIIDFLETSSDKTEVLNMLKNYVKMQNLRFEKLFEAYHEFLIKKELQEGDETKMAEN